jgi:transitional endoplasmic reticulum ATPase
MGQDSKDVAEAILRKKDSINKLIVDDATNDDNSICSMSTATMESLQLFRGDTAILRGKMRKETVLIVLADDEVDNNRIKINKCVRANLRLRLGDGIKN